MIPSSRFHGAIGSPPTAETLDVYGVNQYVYGGGGTFTTNPYTNLPWTLADLQQIWAGYHARWTTPADGARDWQRLSFNDYTVEVLYSTGPVPTLTVSAPTVPRTGMATFTVTADPTADPPAVVSNWTFASPGLSAVVRTAGTTDTTWSGLIAAPGTASVRVVQNGETFNLSRAISVVPRNWTWVAVVAQPVPNGPFDQLPTPPVLGGRLGAALLGWL